MTDGRRKCGWAKCPNRFEPARRSNQHQRAGGDHHEGAVYCSRSCQQKAYRWRVQASRKAVSGTTTHATVTPPKNAQCFQGPARAKNAHARPPFATPDGEIIADSKWPKMYRVKWRDGRLSDVVNYTRAKDALMRATLARSGRSVH
jgi:hypothetical protein